MVWKSDRWQARLELTGDSQSSARPILPEKLEITYRDQDSDELQTEDVYEDLQEKHEQPRLLVSLKSVTALKELCEHEHARHDKVSQTLANCRAAYYKELRWLRDQLHLAYQTDEEAMARKALLTPDDFEVYFFEPPRFLDEDTRDFLLKCIRETNRQLIDENRKLKSELQQVTLFEQGILPTVMRRLIKDNSVSAILTCLHSSLRNKRDLTEFAETCYSILGLGEQENCKELSDSANAHFTAAAVAPDPAMQEEMDALREKTKEQDALIAQLRSQLAAGIDVRLERERADEERKRADLIQQQVDRLEKQQKALKQELRRDPMDTKADRERLKRAVTMSVHKLNEAMQTLTPTGSKHCTPNVSPVAKRTETLTKRLGSPQQEAGSFDDALMHLDSVAWGFEAVANEAAAELQELRSRVAVLEAMRRAAEATDAEAALKPVTPKAAKCSCEEFFEPRIAALEKELAEVRAAHQETQSQLAEERSTCKDLREKLSEAKGEIEDLQLKLEMARHKVRGLRDKLKSLKVRFGLPDDSDDEQDDFDEELDFMVPYRIRAKAAAAKPRWLVLSEDADCKRKRQEYLAKQKGGGEVQEVSKQQEVFAAFDFLSVQQRLPGLQQLKQQFQPHRAPHKVVVTTTSGVAAPPPEPHPGGRRPSGTGCNQPAAQSSPCPSTKPSPRPMQAELSAQPSELRQRMASPSPSPPLPSARARLLMPAGVGQPREEMRSRESASSSRSSGFSAPTAPLHGLAQVNSNATSNAIGQIASHTHSNIEHSPAYPVAPAPVTGEQTQAPQASLRCSSSGGLHDSGIRPARSLRLAAQSSVQTPALTRRPSTSSEERSDVLPQSKMPSLQKGILGGKSFLPDVNADWLMPRRSGGVPLTNAARCLRSTKSAADIPTRPATAAEAGYVVSELLPSFPAGRPLKSNPSWLAGGA